MTWMEKPFHPSHPLSHTPLHCHPFETGGTLALDTHERRRRSLGSERTLDLNRSVCFVRMHFRLAFRSQEEQLSKVFWLLWVKVRRREDPLNRKVGIAFQFLKMVDFFFSVNILCCSVFVWRSNRFFLYRSLEDEVCDDFRGLLAV